MLYRLQTPEPPKHYCHHCGASVPDNKDFCPRCGACANCGLLASELSTVTATTASAFCPNCGARLHLRRPAQDLAQSVVRAVGLVLWGLAIGVLGLIAGVSALLGTCALVAVGSEGVVALLLLLGAAAVTSFCIWAIIALGARQP